MFLSSFYSFSLNRIFRAMIGFEQMGHV